MRLSADLSAETWQARRHDIFKVQKEKQLQPKTFYLARLKFKIEELP